MLSSSRTKLLSKRYWATWNVEKKKHPVKTEMTVLACRRQSSFQLFSYWFLVQRDKVPDKMKKSNCTFGCMSILYAVCWNCLISRMMWEIWKRSKNKQVNNTYRNTRLHNLCHATGPWTPHHSHLGEVDQVVFGVVWRSLLDEGQVSEVHSQVGHAGRITAGGRTEITRITLLYCKFYRCSAQKKWVIELNSLLQSLPQVFEPPLWWDQLLQLVNQCLCLVEKKIILMTARSTSGS